MARDPVHRGKFLADELEALNVSISEPEHRYSLDELLAEHDAGRVPMQEDSAELKVWQETGPVGRELL